MVTNKVSPMTYSDPILAIIKTTAMKVSMQSVTAKPNAQSNTPMSFHVGSLLLKYSWKQSPNVEMHTSVKIPKNN